MDMNGIYQKDNKFDGEESLYYVLLETVVLHV